VPDQYSSRLTPASRSRRRVLDLDQDQIVGVSIKETFTIQARYGLLDERSSLLVQTANRLPK
jgi:hypothetical protein